MRWTLGRRMGEHGQTTSSACVSYCRARDSRSRKRRLDGLLARLHSLRGGDRSQAARSYRRVGAGGRNDRTGRVGSVVVALYHASVAALTLALKFSRPRTKDRHKPARVAGCPITLRDGGPAKFTRK